MASTSDSPFSDSSFLKARIEDAVSLSDRRYSPCFIGFLNKFQRAEAEGMLRHFNGVNALFWGGHEESEKTLLGIFPEDFPAQNESFPLTAMAFSYRKQASISHRDVLGSLLGIGVRREMIGDILCGDAFSVAFMRDEIVSFVSEQLTKIGREGVSLLFPYDGPLPAAHQFREINDTVASARLDCVLKCCLSASREEAARQIKAGLVFLNHCSVLSASAEINAGDVLSVRGVGRFRVETIGPQTRKGRLFITIKQYI